MHWNGWILVFEGSFQLFQLLMVGRAAVVPNCTLLGSTIVQSALLLFGKVLVCPRTVVTTQVTGVILTIQKVKSGLALFIYLKKKC